jgi:hypothetical protein
MNPTTIGFFSSACDDIAIPSVITMAMITAINTLNPFLIWPSS